MTLGKPERRLRSAKGQLIENGDRVIGDLDHKGGALGTDF